MSKFEMVILIMVCLSPILAFFVLKKKKDKSIEKQSVAKIETQPEKQSVEKPNEAKTYVPTKEIDTSEFRNYLKDVKPKTSKPEYKTSPISKTRTLDDVFLDDLKHRGQFDEEKTVADEMKALSPELKAMLLSGLLDKKDFDD